MATTAAPYGLRPVKRADGMPYAGATSSYLIDPAGEATNLFYGQVVHIGADGYIALSTATGANGTTNAFPIGTTLRGSLGVFVGCEYVNAQGQVIFSQYYPSGTTGVVKCYVVDDPNVLFEAQLDGAAAQADVGQNTFFAAAQSTSTGSTRTGNSTSALDATVVATTAAFRIVSFVSATTDAFPDVLVKFNPGYSSMTNAVAPV
tara:strand:- start:1231 stop:1842 length:612 start_codon:yes stop_codon:yes gene_type:complete